MNFKRQQDVLQRSAFAHYLHHKYFEVNYADGMLPLDKWFGTWHDGITEGDRLMKERYKRKKERMNKKGNVSMHLAIIGAGVMGADHARIVAEDLSGAVLQVICDADETRAKEIAERHGVPDMPDLYRKGEMNA